ncbi:hypothetical protein [Chroococcidiopsis sp. SAG 2025]|uniref:hypothetical protein n=1 Tax=Chroococcidiopsis sp. SAG 2025 TaxID=171389 RepID=UPI00293733F4|nr:hypothetical protein [Chroococcidiopsis sp. SAG 2025]
MKTRERTNTPLIVCSRSQTPLIMPEIQTLNKLERKLISFGVTPQPRQTARGSICLPVKYVGASFGAVLSCVGGQPTERWWGQCSPTVQNRIREHFGAFQAVNAL